jgi:hypothetical protein
LVEYVLWPGQAQQIPVYDDCIARHRLEPRWMIYLDLDEFIVPARREVTLTDFLKKMERHPVVEVHWLVYGSGGQTERRPGGVMERFKHHSPQEHEVNRHVKSFIDPRRVGNMTGCHEAARLPGTGYPVDVRGERIRDNWARRKPVGGDIRINHYAVKSHEEFLEKRARGRARALTMRNENYFRRFDRNEIKED